MCMAHEMSCSCGNSTAGFNFKNEIMSGDVINRIYCPECSRDIGFDPETMISDNGWVIEYDMEVARFQSCTLPVAPGEVTPDFIFDAGYCTWRGIYPTDHVDSVTERTEILKLAKMNPRKYLEEMKEWATARMERLTREGWRKTREQSSVRI